MAEMEDVVINIDGSANQNSANSESSIGAPKPAAENKSADLNATSSPILDAEDFKTKLFKKLGVSNSSNPYVCIAHILFKSAAVFTYLFSGWIVNSVMIFILVSIFSVLDFWVVKNVSGRILAGLRWWTTLDERGNEKWVFESFDFQVKANPVDRAFFWYGQIANTLFWTLTLFLKTLTLSPFWVILATIAVALSFTNLYAYYKCNKDYQNKLNSALGSNNVRNMIYSTVKERLGF